MEAPEKKKIRRLCFSAGAIWLDCEGFGWRKEASKRLKVRPKRGQFGLIGAGSTTTRNPYRTRKLRKR